MNLKYNSPKIHTRGRCELYFNDELYDEFTYQSFSDRKRKIQVFLDSISHLYRPYAYIIIKPELKPET